MASISLKNARVEFPAYNSKSRGLVNSLFQFGRSEQKRINSVLTNGNSMPALHDINLDIREGDRLGLVGFNGAGKTTLLRVLSGIYEPTSGIMETQGNISSLTDMMLGMDVDASGYENIFMRGVFLNYSRRQVEALLPDIEEFTELGDYLNLPVRAYSSGMQLKLAFAISTTVCPDILIMDEMVGAGDIKFIQKAQARVNDMLERTKILVLASHDISIIKGFCNRAIWLEKGRIKMSGDVDLVAEDYYKAAQNN